MSRIGRIMVLALTGALSCLSAAAQDVRLELNKLEQHEGNCRVFFVLSNATEKNFSALTFDLVFFDKAGVIQRHLAFDGAPLPGSRTRVKPFELDGLACASVGHVLFNGVLDCRDDNGARNNCFDAIAPSSRAPVKLTE